MFVNLSIEGHLIQKVVHLSTSNSVKPLIWGNVECVNICACVKSTFLTVDLFDKRVIRSCKSGPILWGNMPTALSTISPNPVFGFWINHCRISSYFFLFNQIFSSEFSYLVFFSSPFPKRLQPGWVQRGLHKQHQWDVSSATSHCQPVTYIMIMQIHNAHWKQEP